jgi:hypothetical protein
MMQGHGSCSRNDYRACHCFRAMIASGFVYRGDRLTNARFTVEIWQKITGTFGFLVAVIAGLIVYPLTHTS